MKKRDVSIDVMKGILVLFMVLCHCVQFFGSESKPIMKEICEYVNLTTFSGFLFTFGFACQYAYFQKSFAKAAPRMLKTGLKCLGAFYISSICYVGIVEYNHYDPKVIKEILFLRKYAGWSEFLASFFGIMIVAIVLFALFKHMNLWIFLGIGAVSLASTFLPYDKITNSYLALFLGSTEFITFPLLQYLFYFAAGVYFCKQKKYSRWLVLLIALVCSAPEIYFYAVNRYLSMRFPPDFMYIFGGALIIWLYYLISCGISAVGAKSWLLALPGRFLAVIGENSIFYLLCSNVIIFAFSESKFKLRDLPFIFKFYFLLMAGLFLLQHLVRQNKQ